MKLFANAWNYLTRNRIGKIFKRGSATIFKLEKTLKLDAEPNSFSGVGAHIGNLNIFHLSQQLVEPCPNSCSCLFVDDDIQIRKKPFARIGPRHEIRID
jgi:hypothetical protein